MIDNLGPGGAQRQLVNLAIKFQHAGHSVRFLVYGQSDFFRPHLEENRIECNRLSATSAWSRFCAIRRELRGNRQDAVLAFLPWPSFWAELASIPRRPWKLVVGERSGVDSLLGWKNRLPRLGHCRADQVVANSASLASTLRASFPALRQRIHVIYNAVDLQTFSPIPDYVPSSDGFRTIVVAATYRHLKNLTGLVKAVAILSPKDRSRLRIKWFGNRHDSSFAIATELIRNNRLTEIFCLADVTHEIVQQVRHADAIGLFSFMEGLPNAVCEGMSCGKPIIMSRVSDSDTLVEADGNGWVCDPHKLESIAEAIAGFLNASDDELVEMGRRSRRAAMRLFDPDTIAREYIELMN